MLTDQRKSVLTGESAIPIEADEKVSGTRLQGNEMPQEVGIVQIPWLFGGSMGRDESDHAHWKTEVNHHDTR
eukprot:6362007-Prorocentrum_lima.AAC.1